MARAWITDRWTKAAIIDGHKVQPPAAQLRKLSTLEDKFKTDRFQQGKRWRVSWYETKDGRKRLRSESFDSKSAAEARRAALEDDIRSGRYIDPSHARKPFSEAAEAWINGHKNIKGGTEHRYRRELRMYVLPRWKDTPLADIGKADIDSWVTDLAAGKAPHEYLREKIPAKLSPSSLEHIVQVVFGAVLRNAVQEGWLSRNPAARVEVPRTAASDLVFLTYEEVEALADAAKAVDGPMSAALIRFLAYVGVRINEALAIHVEHVDLDAKRIRITKTWTVDADGNRIEGEPKTWERRTVPIPDFLANELSKLIADQPPEAYLFRAPRGGAIHDHNWRNRVWYKAVAGAGIEIPGFKIHSLRHTCASLAIAAGADVKVIQLMLGHKDASVTLNTYGHLFPDRLDEVTGVMSAQRMTALSKGHHAPVMPRVDSETSAGE